MTDPTIPIESLLAHADWVRALAGRLVGDPSLADDVAQRTWLQALRQPPRNDSNLRGWFSRAVRNSAREIGRGEGRRGRREAAVARPDATAATVDVVARANLQRELAGEVVALDEPYRTTLLLHFFEGLAAGEVAQRMDCPENTVRTRLRRGLELLRARLDGRYGDRATWCALFIPLAPVPRAAAAATLGGGLGGALGTLLLPALAAALAVAVGLRVFLGSAPEVAPQARTPELTVAVGTEERAIARQDELSDVERSSAEARAPATEAETETHLLAPAVPATRRVGTVIAVGGEPLAHVLVRWGDVRARTDGAGGFELESDAPASELSLGESAWTWVARGHLSGTPQEVVTLVAAPTRTVAGRVVDREDRGVAGVRVETIGLSDFGLLPLALSDATAHLPKAVLSGPDGRFALVDVPDVNELPLHANAPPLAETFGDPRIELPRGDVVDLIVRVGADAPADGIEGIVVDARGAAVADARVRFGTHEARTDATGRFVIGVGNTPSGAPLVAFARAVGFAIRPNFEAELARSRRPYPSVELVLTEGAHELRGRVIDSADRSVSGFHVDLIDGSSNGGSSRWLECEVAGPIVAPTDADGRFHVTGLSDRTYRLRAWHTDGRVVESPPLDPNGEDAAFVQLLVPEEPWAGPLRGRVVDLRGRALAGVSARVMVPTFDSAEAGDGSTGRGPDRWTTSTSTDLTAETDGEGRFILPRVPRGATGVELSFSGDQVRTKSFPISEVLAGERDFELTALGFVRVADEALQPGDVISFLDGNGYPVVVLWRSTASSTTAMSYVLDASDPPLLRVEQTAVAATVARRGEGEIARVSVDLVAGEVWELNF